LGGGQAREEAPRFRRHGRRRGVRLPVPFVRDQDWHPDGPADIRGRRSDAQHRQEDSGLPAGSGEGERRAEQRIQSS